MPLNKRRILSILISKTERKLGDNSASDGETNEKRPVTVPLSLEKHGPWIEFPHPLLNLSSLSLSRSRSFLPQYFTQTPLFEPVSIPVSISPWLYLPTNFNISNNNPTLSETYTTSTVRFHRRSTILTARITLITPLTSLPFMW